MIGSVSSGSYLYAKSMMSTAGRTGPALEYQKTAAAALAYDSRAIRGDSTVARFIEKHPDSKGHVYNQVNAGKRVIQQNDAAQIDRSCMTMEEYKAFFTSLMNTIAFDPSQWNTSETWSITEAGWEQMKKDPDYEAWVLGYTVENRSVHFPQGLADRGSVCFEHFGASIEEHHGEGYPKTTARTDKEDRESWWVKRRRKHEEMIKRQMKESLEKRRMRSKQLASYEANFVTMDPVTRMGTWRG